MTNLLGLKGKWKVIGCRLKTKWLPLSVFENFIYEFPDESHYSLFWGKLTFPDYVDGFPKSDQGKISIDNRVEPHTIDLIPASGPFVGKTFKGIFHLDHDILKGNFAFPGEERPTNFKGEEGQVYEIWQRI